MLRCEVRVGVNQSFANFFSKFAVWSRNAETRAKFAHPLAKIASPARFLCHIFIHRSPGLLPVRREIPDTGQTPDHPPPIAREQIKGADTWIGIASCGVLGSVCCVV